MAAPYAHRRAPPGIYRAARALRSAAAIAIVLIVVFVGVVAFSAFQVVRSAPQVASPALAMEPNGTVGFTTSFTLKNTGYLPIEHLALRVLVLNATGGLIVGARDPPRTVASGASVLVPIAIYVPLNSTAATTLLTEDQYLRWNVWGNATFGYLFPVSIALDEERSWGAPFDDLAFSVGAVAESGGQVSVPVTIAFMNDASFADAGTIDFQVVAPSAATCASGSFVLNVAPGDAYQSTQNVAVASGCDPGGGHIAAEYVSGGSVIPLPPEAIP